MPAAWSSHEELKHHHLVHDAYVRDCWLGSNLRVYKKGGLSFGNCVTFAWAGTDRVAAVRDLDSH